MKSRLGELGLQSKDVGGAGDCFFRSVSAYTYCWGSIYERDNPVRFIESNTENSWLSRISGSDMSIFQGLMHLSSKQLQMH